MRAILGALQMLALCWLLGGFVAATTLWPGGQAWEWLVSVPLWLSLWLWVVRGAVWLLFGPGAPRVR